MITLYIYVKSNDHQMMTTRQKTRNDKGMGWR